MTHHDYSNIMLTKQTAISGMVLSAYMEYRNNHVVNILNEAWVKADIKPYL